MKRILFTAVAIVGMTGAANADDWSNSVGQSFSVVSPGFEAVAVDAAGAPVDVSQINSDGSFKSCGTCTWVPMASLTPAQQQAVNDDANAARHTRSSVTVTDATTGDGMSFTRTNGGVFTSASLSDGEDTTTATAKGVVTTGSISAKTVSVGGRDVGSSLGDHDDRITANKKQADATDNRLNGFNGTGGTVETWATGVDTSLANHGAAISDLYGITGQQGLQIAGLYDITAAHSAQLADLRSDMKRVKGGVALALALDVPHLETGRRFGVAVNLADFEGTGAFAGGVALRLDQNWQVNAGGGLGFNGGAAGGKVGLVGQW